jgi:hypothetical protein
MGEVVRGSGREQMHSITGELRVRDGGVDGGEAEVVKLMRHVPP